MSSLRGSMGLVLVLLCLVVGCIAPPSDGRRPPAPPPDGGFAPVITFGLGESIPPTMHDRRGALQLAAVADEYARCIAFDGTTKEPKLNTTNDIGDRLLAMTTYAFEDHSPATAAFRDVVARVLDEHLEPAGEGQELSPALRVRSAEIFRAVAYGLRQVRDGE